MLGFGRISLAIIGALGIALATCLWLISEYREDIADLERTLVIKQVNERTLKGSIQRQNLEMDALGAEYALRIVEYNDKAPKVVTKYVDRIVTKEVNVERSSCEDVNLVLDNIRAAGI